MPADAAVTEWLPAALRRAPDAASRALAGLVALNYVGALATVTVLFPPPQGLGRLQSDAARGPLAVVASGLLVVKLLRSRCRSTITPFVRPNFYLATAIPGRERRDAEKAHPP